MANEDVSNGAAAKNTVTFTTFKLTLIVEAQKVGEAVAFYKSAFGAVEIGHSFYPKRKLDEELPHVIFAELEIAGSIFVVRDVTTLPGSFKKPEGGTMLLSLETDDAEAAVEKAVTEGAVKVEVTDVEGEDGVNGKVTDPFGFTWIILSPAKKIEDIKNVEKDRNKAV